MADEAVLAQKARDAICNGALPARTANRTFGGPGNGAICAVCGEPVTSNQMELEIESNRQARRPDWTDIICTRSASRRGSSSVRRAGRTSGSVRAPGAPRRHPPARNSSTK